MTVSELRIARVLGAISVAGSLLFSSPVSATEPAGDGIRLCSTGYLPELAKTATVVGAGEGAATFSLLDSGTGMTVFTGVLGPARNSAATKEVARLADFSRFAVPGSYMMRVDGLPESEAFTIAPDTLNSSLRLVMLGFYNQRCGEAVSMEWNGQTFSHPACHTEDAWLDHYDPALAGQKKVATGGWHDAGDYGKYTVNSAISCGIMLSAWERNGDALSRLKLPIPESGGAIPDYLAEIKYNLDWMLTMQFQDGKVSHKLTPERFCIMGTMPQDDLQKRYFAPWSKVATLDFAAVGCMAARVFKPYDPAYAKQWEDAARMAWEAARGQPDVNPDLSAFHTGAYLAPAEVNMKWAVIEVALTFGEDYLTEAERVLFAAVTDDENRVFSVNWDWSNGYNLGLYSYLFSEKAKEKPLVLARLRRDLIGAADAIVANHDAHAYGRGLSVYYWGCNGGVARTTMNLNAAYIISGDRKYLDAAFDQIAYLYGRNPFNRSFVSGDGINPPMFLHHRPSAGDGIEPPWPGHLSGGPTPAELDWFDITKSFRTNEIAINWDASLAYALSIFYDPAAQ
ncbi:MAG: glycoside hydrolase family 9 protein [Opitutales bacterium]|jgi:endoglucanase